MHWHFTTALSTLPFWKRSKVRNFISHLDIRFSIFRNTGNGILESIIWKEVLWGGMTPDPARRSGMQRSPSTRMASTVIKSTLLKRSPIPMPEMHLWGRVLLFSGHNMKGRLHRKIKIQTTPRLQFWNKLAKTGFFLTKFEKNECFYRA